ncbi:hypothetical protein Q8F55_008558 [Vanrija albida]|uniref:Uncharacterized protein n=1 Tax=Vanrija albida TaxID=181172 RepID=A0ABR3PR55_9TREE
MLAQKVFDCDDGSHTGCSLFSFGMDSKFMIGLHHCNLEPVLLPSAPVDDPELSFHLGLWFSQHATVVIDGILAHMNDRPAAQCGTKCGTRSLLPRIVYGTQVPNKREPMEVVVVDKPQKRVKKRGKKSKGKPAVGNQELFIVGTCESCFIDDVKTALVEHEAAAAAAAAATATADANATPGPSMIDDAEATDRPKDNTTATSQDRTPLAGRPQTCFCEICSTRRPATPASTTATWRTTRA